MIDTIEAFGLFLRDRGLRFDAFAPRFRASNAVEKFEELKSQGNE